MQFSVMKGCVGVIQKLFVIIILLQIQVSGQTYNCDQYKRGCDEYCGGSALVDSFKCSLSQTGQSGTHSCVCKSLPDLFQNLKVCDDYKAQCTAICDKQATPSKKVTPQINCEPNGMHSIGFSCECQIEDLTAKNSAVKCYNHLPESEGTCDDRLFWGSCEEWWMRSKYFCAETCNFCEWGAKQDYDCYEEYQNCQTRCDGREENIQEFACYTNLKKNDCICKPGVNIVNNPSPILGAIELPDEECYDTLPSKEGTCEMRVSWGSCTEYWMQEKNYCARSCGYCTPISDKQTPKVTPSPPSLPSPILAAQLSPSPAFFSTEEIPLTTLMSNLSLQISPSPPTPSPLPSPPPPSPSPSPSPVSAPPVVLEPITINVPSIVLPQLPNTPIQQVVDEVTTEQNGGSGIDLSAQVGPSTSILEGDSAQNINEGVFTGRSLILDLNETTTSNSYTVVSENSPLSSQNDNQQSVYVAAQQPPSQSSPSTTQEEEFGSKWVENHNKYRNQHCVPGMSWSGDLYEAALSLSSECAYAESSEYGQNFYRASGYGSLDDIFDPIGYIVNYWYDQGLQNGFDSTNPQFLPDAGTTTQVIWKNSVKVGCAWKECADNWLYVNCLYDQPGNIVSEFNSNIQPLC